MYFNSNYVGKLFEKIPNQPKTNVFGTGGQKIKKLIQKQLVEHAIHAIYITRTSQ